MKNTKVFFVIALFAILFTSCSKEDKNSNLDETKLEKASELIENNENMDLSESIEVDKLEEVDERESTEPGETSASSMKWDKILDSYEEIIEEQINLIKKLDEGDISTIQKQLKNLDKLTALSKEMENAYDDMNETQLKRFLDLQDKYAKAVSK